MATNTEQLQAELKDTADNAVTLARTTAESAAKDLQQAATDLRDQAHQVFLAGLGALAMAEEEGSKLFKKLVRRGEKVEKKGLDEPMKKLRGQFDVQTAKVQLAVKERAGDAQYMAEEAAGRVEDRVQEAVAVVMKRVGVPTRAEISELTASVERLTQRIERLKQERTVAVKEARESAREVTYEGVGGGWYEIRVGEVVVEKVQGREDAEAAVARLSEQG